MDAYVKKGFLYGWLLKQEKYVCFHNINQTLSVALASKAVMMVVGT